MKKKIKDNMHWLLLLFFPFQIVWYQILEKTSRGREWFISVHCVLDDIIPFVPVFIIFYILWYFYVAFSLIYTGLKDKKEFIRLMVFYASEVSLTLLFCTIVPNGHDLRPVLENPQNIWEYATKFIYVVDPHCVNVLPSMHVMNSVGASIAIARCVNLKDKGWVKILCLSFTVLVIFSTVLVKQHSAIDVLATPVLIVPCLLLAYKSKLVNRLL